MPFRTGKRRISIHAPAKGATPRSYHVTSISSDFNPRSREGSDAFVNVIALQHIPDFNPRSREGSDKKGQAENVCPFYFNPRSREGSDYGRSQGGRIKTISIHAPAKGATAEGVVEILTYRISIHAPAKGATEHYFPRLFLRQISIHAPAKGATADAAMLYLAGVFQSTLPRRERP